jgi:hypothetical protein
MMALNYMCEQSRHPLAREPEFIDKEEEQLECAAVAPCTPGNGRLGR